MSKSYKSSTRAITSFALLISILVGGMSHEAMAIEKYKDLEISPMYFSDVSTCLADDSRTPKIYECRSQNWFFENPQGQTTIWAFSIKNKGKAAYTNVRSEIVLQNNTGADLYNNILLVTSRIEPGETLWVAPERSSAPSTQSAFQGVTQGSAKIISAKKSQPGKYRIKGFTEADIGSISDAPTPAPLQTQFQSNPQIFYASADKGVFKNFAYTMDVEITVAVDKSAVPLQWITVLQKDSDGKILGGYKYQNDSISSTSYKGTLMQDKDYLKRLVTLEVHVSRRANPQSGSGQSSGTSIDAGSDNNSQVQISVEKATRLASVANDAAINLNTNAFNEKAYKDALDTINKAIASANNAVEKAKDAAKNAKDSAKDAAESQVKAAEKALEAAKSAKQAANEAKSINSTISGIRDALKNTEISRVKSSSKSCETNVALIAGVLGFAGAGVTVLTGGVLLPLVLVASSVATSVVGAAKC